MLKFEYILDMADKEVGSTYSELDSNITTSYKVKDFLKDKTADVVNGEFDLVNLEDWTSGPSKLTKGEILSFGVKTFPGIGPYGFYTDNESRTSIKIPIRKPGDLPKIKELTLTNKANTISYELSGDIAIYEFVRIIADGVNDSYEFMTSKISGEILKPAGMSGEYSFTCIGYRDEIQSFSDPSEPVIMTIN